MSLKTGEFLKEMAEGSIKNRGQCLLRENGGKERDEEKAKLLNSNFGLI